MRLDITGDRLRPGDEPVGTEGVGVISRPETVGTESVGPVSGR